MSTLKSKEIRPEKLRGDAQWKEIYVSVLGSQCGQDLKTFTEVEVDNTSKTVFRYKDKIIWAEFGEWIELDLDYTTLEIPKLIVGDSTFDVGI